MKRFIVFVVCGMVVACACCVNGGASENIFYCFDGVEKKELFRVKSALYVHGKYLTPDMLYWIASNTGGDWFYELWYYELGTGEFGKIIRLKRYMGNLE